MQQGPQANHSNNETIRTTCNNENANSSSSVQGTQASQSNETIRTTCHNENANISSSVQDNQNNQSNSSINESNLSNTSSVKDLLDNYPPERAKKIHNLKKKRKQVDTSFSQLDVDFSNSYIDDDFSTNSENLDLHRENEEEEDM